MKNTLAFYTAVVIVSRLKTLSNALQCYLPQQKVKTHDKHTSLLHYYFTHPFSKLNRTINTRVHYYIAEYESKVK